MYQIEVFDRRDAQSAIGDRTHGYNRRKAFGISEREARRLPPCRYTSTGQGSTAFPESAGRYSKYGTDIDLVVVACNSRALWPGPSVADCASIGGAAMNMEAAAASTLTRVITFVCMLWPDVAYLKSVGPMTFQLRRLMIAPADAGCKRC